MNNILLVALLNIITFILASYWGNKQGYIEGHKNGTREEQLVMGVAITRAYSEDKEDALRKVGNAYKQLHLEVEQELRDRNEGR